LAPPETFLDRYPNELSGGQRQRVALARALVVQPEFLVADEPVSMLDVSIRAGVMNLMLELKQKFGLTCIFITHDLSVARYMCDRLMIMYLGKILEKGPVEELISEPFHPYTQALLAAVPIPDPEIRYHLEVIETEVASSINPPAGCRFHPRCRYAKSTCRQQEPQMVEVGKNRFVACHLFS
jgi:oligopeptide/dipeptide ABC transporter ATP-binding protein